MAEKIANMPIKGMIFSPGQKVQADKRPNMNGAGSCIREMFYDENGLETGHKSYF